MRSKTEKQLAIKCKNDGYSYKKIADLLSISRQSAVNMCSSANCGSGTFFPRDPRVTLFALI